jgi:hypothetical protein
LHAGAGWLLHPDFDDTLLVRWRDSASLAGCVYTGLRCMIAVRHELLRIWNVGRC